MAKRWRWSDHKRWFRSLYENGKYLATVAFRREGDWYWYAPGGFNSLNRGQTFKNRAEAEAAARAHVDSRAE